MKYFSQVAAVEPNGDMREKFTAFLPEVNCFDTTGENTGLPENSVDLITVAQAFHWLDEEKFKKEMMRILKTAEGDIVLDVTGSNINFARLVYDKLPMFYGEIEQKGYLNDF